MSETHWERIETVFDAARKLSDQAREKYLQGACAGDGALRKEVESLLNHHDEAGRFLEPGPRPPLPDSTGPGTDGLSIHLACADPEDLVIGKKIGSCQVIRLIAQGGMGAVYEAQQESPRRRVALKLIRPEAASPSMLRRFEYEAEILARLRHPGIAEVYEVGVCETAPGLKVPYFVMELISGAKTLIQFADEGGLGVKERLELFARICDTVHHGHQKGVIHRDLKPGNILIDATGQPKVIDFGIARATDADLAMTSFRTELGQILGTLPYMSPEQCRADPLDIDLRSDVYSLGVVLYELLCGLLPYEFKRNAIHEVVRTIQEEPPRRPSTVHVVLRGDVETITLKALEKSRERRYGSAAELAEDLRRYLSNQPIHARPPSLPYQVRLFARRHKALFSAAAIVFAAMIAAVIVSAIFAADANRAREGETARAEKEREARERAERLFNEGESLAKWVLREHLDAIRKLVGSTQARKEVADRVRIYLENLSRDASESSALEQDISSAWQRLGDVLGSPYDQNLGQTGEAIECYRKALALQERFVAAPAANDQDRSGLALLCGRLGDALLVAGKSGEAHQLFLRARTIAEGLAQSSPSDASAHGLLSNALARLAGSSEARGDLAEARRLLGAGLEANERAVELDPRDAAQRAYQARLHLNLGNLCRKLGDSSSSREHFKQVRALMPSISVADDALKNRELSRTCIFLGDALWEEDDTQGALDSYRASEKLDRVVVAADAANASARAHLALSVERIGDALEKLGELDGALDSYRQTVQIRRELSLLDPANQGLSREISLSLFNVGKLLVALKRHREAIQPIEESQSISEKLLQAQPDSVEHVRDLAAGANELGKIHTRCAAEAPDSRAALPSLREALRSYQRSIELFRGLKARGLLAPADEEIVKAISRLEAERADQVRQVEAGKSVD